MIILAHDFRATSSQAQNVFFFSQNRFLNFLNFRNFVSFVHVHLYLFILIIYSYLSIYLGYIKK